MPSITLHSRGIADLSPNGVSGWPQGLGIRQLRFSVRYDALGREQVMIAGGFRAIVTASLPSQRSNYLGTAWPESPWVIRTTQYGDRNRVILFHLDLSDAQISAIENLRLGGDIPFDLRVMCEVSAGVDVTYSADNVRFLVNKSEWFACLNAFGLDRTVLLEVVIPTPEGRLGAAAKLLQRARRELDVGNYDWVVQEGRRAVESVHNVLKRAPAIPIAVEHYRGTREVREAMTKSGRALVVAAAAKHYSHLAHHVGKSDGEAFHFGRRDASFMLALASAVVSNAMASSGTRRKPVPRAKAGASCESDTHSMTRPCSSSADSPD
jgi:hypothetical protein